MEVSVTITKDLQEAYRHCCEENCNEGCIASMSNGDCFFEFLQTDELEDAIFSQ